MDNNPDGEAAHVLKELQINAGDLGTASARKKHERRERRKRRERWEKCFRRSEKWKSICWESEGVSTCQDLKECGHQIESRCVLVHDICFEAGAIVQLSELISPAHHTLFYHCFILSKLWANCTSLVLDMSCSSLTFPYCAVDLIARTWGLLGRLGLWSVVRIPSRNNLWGVQEWQELLFGCMCKCEYFRASWFQVCILDCLTLFDHVHFVTYRQCGAASELCCFVVSAQC